MVDLDDRSALAAAAAVHPTAWAVYLSRYAGDGTWSNAAHFDFLADKVLDMHAGKLQRLCVSMPPGSGKSEFLSLSVASWWLGTRPESRVVIASYGKSLSCGWSERARDAMATLGPEVFGVGANSREKAEFWRPRDPETGKAFPGYFFAVGRGGPLTGKRAELLIVDDLLKDDLEASSPTVREHAWRWFDKVAMTRLLPGSCVIQIATRWHEDDPIGRLEQKQERGDVELPWTFVNLPALAEKDDALGREPGEALWPAMWPADRLLKVKQGRDAYTWSALYQGRPTPEGGGMFKREWFQYFVDAGDKLEGPGVSTPTTHLAKFATLDLAFSTKTSADFAVCCVFGADLKNEVLYLLHVERDRVGAEGLAHWIRRIFDRWKVRKGYMERSGFYADITNYLRTVARLPLREIQPNTDKTSRAQPAAALMASGGLLFRDGAPWLKEFESELLSFPHAAHDDQVDALAFGVHVFNGQPKGPPQRNHYKPEASGTWRIGR